MCELEKEIEAYMATDPWEPPYTYKGFPGFTMHKMTTRCPDCMTELQDLRGKATEHAACIDVSLKGICEDCKALVPVRWRWYPNEDRIMVVHGEGDWHEYWLKPSIWTSVKKFFRSFWKGVVGK